MKTALSFVAGTVAALVLAASFATICYADYRADIDAVRPRLMAATSRSLHEPQLIPDAEPFHRGEAPPGRRRERRRRRWHGRCRQSRWKRGGRRHRRGQRRGRRHERQRKPGQKR